MGMSFSHEVAAEDPTFSIDANAAQAVIQIALCAINNLDHTNKRTTERVYLVKSSSCHLSGMAVVKPLSLGHAVEFAFAWRFQVGNPLVEPALEELVVVLGALLLPKVPAVGRAGPDVARGVPLGRAIALLSVRTFANFDEDAAPASSAARPLRLPFAPGSRAVPFLNFVAFGVLVDEQLLRAGLAPVAGSRASHVPVSPDLGGQSLAIIIVG